jgi:hypothetical protein
MHHSGQVPSRVVGDASQSGPTARIRLATDRRTGTLRVTPHLRPVGTVR